MSDTQLGRLNDKTYFLRQVGGRDDGVIEPGETVQVVVRNTRGEERIYTVDQARPELARLGVDSSQLHVGSHVTPLAAYVSGLQTAQRNVVPGRLHVGVSLTLNQAIQNAYFAGILPDWQRVEQILTGVLTTLRGIYDDARQHQDQQMEDAAAAVGGAYLMLLQDYHSVAAEPPARQREILRMVFEEEGVQRI